METEIRAERLPAAIHVCRNSQDLRNAVQDCDVIITRGVVLTAYGFLLGLGKALVLDMYSPVLLEGIQRETEADLLDKMSSYENDLDALKLQLGAGDFFICADERQRDYWLGMLSAVGRVNPYTHGQDATLRRLVDLVPFGLPDTLPQHTRAVLKGVHKTIASGDKVILWGGGIWNWLDAPTLIKAMPLVLQQRTDVKLFFMGVKRPNPNIARMKAVDEAMNLSRDLGLLDTYVFFNDWVPYEERGNYLLEADIGVSLHLDHVETRFAFRTRLLDYVWAGLPTLATAGDVLGETLAQERLARIVSPKDVDGVARAILTLLSNPTLRTESAPGFRRVAERYKWEKVTQPLVEFCAAPYLAPDKAYLAQRVSFIETRGTSRSLASKSLRALRLGGVRGLYRQASAYLSWKMRK
jgi:glycosyltransferase involved in cell wall biosynthesis